MSCNDFNGFSEVARDHASQARNYGPLDQFNGRAYITGPCGDSMVFWVSLRGGKIEKVSFVTDGCGSSRAAGSMASCLATDRQFEGAEPLGQQDILDALGGFPPEVEHCALLAAITLQAACEDSMTRGQAFYSEPAWGEPRSNCGSSDCQHGGHKPHESKEKNQAGPQSAARSDAPVNQTQTDTDFKQPKMKAEDKHMRIAIPLADGKLAIHFGHCAQFALVDVDPQSKKAIKREDIAAPPHEPGLLPPWLAERGVTMIIAGGMGQRAQTLFSEQGIQVLVGAPAETPEDLVGKYLAGTLEAGTNICDH
ncbi:hypothetical protein CVU37_13000 [candidate division BRC1 bacterium HGW-BRC1-1]|jgi:predicted Fe-Mo cluster-binding NifX family protein/NifU-like protein involved in Fe-S cluster formation|nr:MAG: hypothetical protein CVU37_13000 [candidate division BRC1 bacterium HGW-BRC1-1]